MRTPLVLIFVLAFAGCSKRPPVPPTSAFETQLAPEPFYVAARAKLAPLLAPETKLTREDTADGLVLRFSTQAGSSTDVRLVEVSLSTNKTTPARVTVRSQPFAFFRPGERDQHDAELEHQVASLLR